MNRYLHIACYIRSSLVDCKCTGKTLNYIVIDRISRYELDGIRCSVAVPYIRCLRWILPYITTINGSCTVKRRICKSIAICDRGRMNRRLHGIRNNRCCLCDSYFNLGVHANVVHIIAWYEHNVIFCRIAVRNRRLSVRTRPLITTRYRSAAADSRISKSLPVCDASSCKSYARHAGCCRINSNDTSKTCSFFVISRIIRNELNGICSSTLRNTGCERLICPLKMTGNGQSR